MLTGGSAATYYAPAVYQSADLDFILQFGGTPQREAAAKALRDLGYAEHGGTYVHATNNLSLEFPPGPLAVGSDVIREWRTVRKRGLLLHVLTPTDSVRDRLIGFYAWNDRASLDAALGVARAQRIDVNKVSTWSAREGYADRLKEFLRLLRS